MIELYHNALSTCSQKVRLVLNHKNINWKSHEIDLRTGGQFTPEFVKINPSAQVPVLKHDGKYITESTVICEYLDDLVPDATLKPENLYLRAQMRLWTKRVDEAIHPAIGAITLSSVLRVMQLQRPREDVLEEIEAASCPAIRKIKHSIFERGADAPEVLPALLAMKGILAGMEKALAHQNWLAGDTLFLADMALVPYVLRLEHLGIDFLSTKASHPHLHAWFDKMKSEPSYKTAILDFVPAGTAEMFAAAAGDAVETMRTLMDERT